MVGKLLKDNWEGETIEGEGGLRRLANSSPQSGDDGAKGSQLAPSDRHACQVPKPSRRDDRKALHLGGGGDC